MATELNGLGNFVECSQSNEPVTKNNTELSKSETSKSDEKSEEEEKQEQIPNHGSKIKIIED